MEVFIHWVGVIVIVLLSIGLITVLAWIIFQLLATAWETRHDRQFYRVIRWIRREPQSSSPEFKGQVRAWRAAVEGSGITYEQAKDFLRIFGEKLKE